jgi:prepilin-type processing-associated H-X9-DG protein
VQILPHLEQGSLYAKFDMEGHFAALQGDSPAEPNDNQQAQNTPLPLFKCPSDPAPREDDPSLNYMGVQGGGGELDARCRTGSASNYRLQFDNGILYTNSSVRFGDVIDGSSNVFLVGESRWWSYEHTNVGWPSWFSWASSNRTAGGSGHVLVMAAAVDPINNPLVDYDSAKGWVDGSGNYTNTLNLGTHTRCFGSRHPGGCHFALADGSVHFFSENMDLATYRQLGARDDGRPVGGYSP